MGNPKQFSQRLHQFMRTPGWGFMAGERIGSWLGLTLGRLVWYPLRKLCFAKFHWSVTIHPGCQFRQRINIALARSVTVGRGGVLQAPVDARLEIGEGTQLNPYTVIYGRVTVGRKVMIAPHAMLAGGNHNFQRLGIPMMDQGSSSKGGIHVEDDVWIGANAVILDGVTVGTGAIVAAGSVVTKSVEAYSIVAGVPARKVGSRNGSA